MMCPTYKCCAVGTVSLTVYIISDSKAKCMSLLNKNYRRIKEHTVDIDHSSARPMGSRYFFGRKKGVNQALLPEPIFFVNVPGDWSDDEIDEYFIKMQQRRLRNEQKNRTRTWF